jgi:hypothetical protein
MKKWKLITTREMYMMFGLSLMVSLIYAGVSFAQAPEAVPYVTMSEKIGAYIILWRGFDVLIYFFQGVLLFTGLGFTAYYLYLFHNAEFVKSLRKKLAASIDDNSSLQQKIDFEIELLSDRFLFLEMMIAAAPVAGLLGTVVGLLQVFDVQTKMTHITMKSITGGMYVAMVTTVCGLIVALIGVTGRHFLNSRLTELRVQLAKEE